MTEIIVRTHRGAYSGGDILYGAVYLKIDAPTSAYGVRLKFFGYETYYFSAIQSWKTSEEGRVIQDTKEYIQCHDIQLYDFGGPIALGHYVFPFKKSLPKDLPRSFHHSSVAGPKWQAQIVYQVEAELMGAESVKDTQSYQVNQALEKEYNIPCMKTSQTISTSGRLPLQKTSFTAVASLDSDTYNIGDTIKLNLEFQTKGFSKAKIEHIKVQLVRDFVLVFRKCLSSDDLASSSSTDPISLSGLSKILPPLLSIKAHSGYNSMSRNLARPEGQAHVLQTRDIMDRFHEGINLMKGLQQLLLPLECQSGGAVPCSTLGTHILCIYAVHIEVSLRDGGTVSLCIPVPNVQERPHMWEAWDPPEWLSYCRVMKVTHQEYRVSATTLDSEVFCKLPSFQTI